ncbi:MAG TPA: hypothetical protein VG713_08490 [Pirellulales bacterium]|nr:hypothetical protein [Pirellulales bacterium]
MAEALLVSTRKGLFQLVRAAGAWSIERTSFLGQNVTLALADGRDDSLYAALNLGHFGVKLHRSADNGATWDERAVPVYPAGEEIRTGDGKPPSPASLKMLWALEAGPVSQPGRLWAGTLPGGLFSSDDAGQSWQLVRGLWDRAERANWFGGGYDTPGIHSICIDPRSPAIVRVAISTGGVWATFDGGATWEQTAHGMRAAYLPPELAHEPNSQDVHRMVQCPAAPDHFWAQHHNGVFRSTDAARSWQEVPNVTPSVFGFAVAVHPHDPHTTWFVPAVKDECRVPVGGRLVVARTCDGGETFHELTNGLPQETSYDLVYRHALDVDSSGERLAVGSTTGGLWISENGGESWDMAAARLPPIHAVRFA